MLIVEKTDRGVEISSDQGDVYTHNLSGDTWSIYKDLIAVAEPMGQGDAQWYTVGLHDLVFVSRGRRSDSDLELTLDNWMWRVHQIRDRPPRPLGTQWRAGSAGGKRFQFIWGYHPDHSFVQPIDAETGKPDVEGWWLDEVTGGQHKRIRNCVVYDGGFLISSKESPNHEIWVKRDGSRWREIEREYIATYGLDQTKNAWSHQATGVDENGPFIVFAVPRTGDVKKWQDTIANPITVLVSQAELKKLAGTDRWCQWWHGSISAHGTKAVFSLLVGTGDDQYFDGIYKLDVTNGSVTLVEKAQDRTVDKANFRRMARPTMDPEAKWCAWHEGGKVIAKELNPSPVPPTKIAPTVQQQIEELKQQLSSLASTVDIVNAHNATTTKVIVDLMDYTRGNRARIEKLEHQVAMLRGWASSFKPDI